MSADIKKYLPYIIGGVVVLYLLYKVMGRGGGGQAVQPTVPQTQIVQTPQTDPLAVLRGQAFQTLSEFDLGAIQAEAQTAQANAGLALAQQQQNLQYQLGTQQIAAGVQEASFAAQAQQQAAQNAYNQQMFQQQAQAQALSNYYGALNTQSILGSVNNALGTIFGGFGGVNPVITF